MTSDSDTFQRLPTFAKPSNYKIHLEPNLEEFTANGHVKIKINFTEPTNFVKLHFGCRELKSAKLTLENGKEWGNLKVDLDKKWLTIVVNFPEKLEPQQATLTINFENEINKGLNGLYRATYKDKDGNPHVLACSQFESEYARLCFPCFDEPEFKAIFDVELLVDQKLVALSNMNVTGEEKIKDKKLVKFAPTPIMSTYLMAFIIGDFEYAEVTYGEEKIPIRVYTTPGKKEQTNRSLVWAKAAMEFFDNWFGFKCPLPKVDLVAIPDFGMGAMENFGLVTFREMYLVHNDQTAHQVSAHSVMVIFHELAHFWFGNLVSIKWWSQLWLKEGFASFCQYYGVENNFPEFNIMFDYLADITSSGMKADEIKSSHSIELTINAPSEMDSYYDSITYHKSNNIISMLKNYLGESVFVDGIRRYIKKFAYSNTGTKDLWDSLSDASGQDIAKIMDTWTKQMGFPQIIVEDEQLEGNKRRLKLKQLRYLADGTTDDQLWQIPLTFIKKSSANEPFHKFLFTEREQEIVLDNVAENEWIKLNYGTSGFYRVQYSNSMLNRLTEALGRGELDTKERYGLASDLMAFVESGKAPYSQLLAFVAALVNEDEYIIWRVVDTGLSKFMMLLDRHDPNLKVKLQKFVCQILEPVSKRLGWEFAKGEAAHRSLVRGLILNLLVKANHEETIDNALKLFNEYVGGKKDAVHPELRRLVFTTAAKKHKQGATNLMKIFETCGDGGMERDCIMSMSHVGNEGDLKKIFDQGILESKFRAQDIYFSFAATDAGALQQDVIWNHFKTNFPKLIERYGGRFENLNCSRCFGLSASNQSTEQFALEFEAFFNSLDKEIRDAWNTTYKQSLERVRLNEKLYKNQHKSVEEFLASF